MTTYARRLGLFSGTMAVIGGIIGGGIFRTPAVVAERVGSPGLILAAWGTGGAVALIGAFCFAELGQRRPRAGGGYVYLREAWGPLPAFLYGWALLLVIASGAIAAVAVTFADYILALAGLPPGLTLPVAIGAILFLSAVNYVGVKPGAMVQNLFTVLKLAALAALIAAGLAAGLPVTPPDPPPAPSGFGAALVPILFTYGGWQQTNFIAEEMIEPERDLPRALLIGVGVVIGVYLLANLAYLRVLGAAGLAASTAPAADLMRIVLGPSGGTVIAAGIAASTFGFLNLVILVTPRVFQAMAADGVFFPQLARLIRCTAHRRWRSRCRRDGPPCLRCPGTLANWWTTSPLLTGSSSGSPRRAFSYTVRATGDGVSSRLRAHSGSRAIPGRRRCSSRRRSSSWRARSSPTRSTR